MMFGRIIHMRTRSMHWRIGEIQNKLVLITWSVKSGEKWEMCNMYAWEYSSGCSIVTRVYPTPSNTFNTFKNRK